MTARFLAFALLLSPLAPAAGVLAGAETPRPAIELLVDAREAPRRIFHVTERVPSAAGPLTLVYPKWIPGEHGPTGPVRDVAGLRFSQGGKALSWHRDPADMFAFRCEVPEAGTVDVAFDTLYPNDEAATDALAVVLWNRMLLYPAGAASDAVPFHARLVLPAGWTFGTALPAARADGASVDFETVALTTLVDSPVLAGAHLKTFPLGEPGGVRHELHAAADRASDLAASPETLARFRNLVAESGALFGARHYRSYHFLLSLSDHVAVDGLEHHESSDNKLAERTLVEPDVLKAAATLMPHEMTHSWNGKYRRPAGLATKNYQEPMRGDLLWIYEGLTNYLGTVLAARSGFLSAEEFRAKLACVASGMTHRPGRAWRPLEDTAVAAQILYTAPTEWSSWRRGVDYYEEGTLLWLEVDATLRSVSGGKRSLDDFCRAFHGGASGGPAVVPYTLEDVVAALDSVAKHDWRAFFAERVERASPQAPLGGLARSGWRLVYRDTPTPYDQATGGGGAGNINVPAGRPINQVATLGLLVKEDGTIADVVPDMPAARAGLAPAMKLIAVAGHRFTKETLADAVRDSRATTEPMEVIVASGEVVRSARVDYHGGARFPHLERAEGPDYLLEIAKPRAASAK